MDLRGDEKPYDKELSPFALPHVRAEDEEFVSYKDFDNGFKPKKKISVGSMVATIAKVGRLPLLLGKCTKIGKKKKKLHVWLDATNQERTRIIRLDKCVPAPSINEFVRRLESGLWYQVKGLTHEFVALNRILYSPNVADAADAENTAKAATTADDTPAADPQPTASSAAAAGTLLWLLSLSAYETRVYVCICTPTNTQMAFRRHRKYS